MTAKWQPEVWELDGLRIFQRPGRGATMPGTPPGAAMRLPPANFRRPSGARSRRGHNFVAHSNRTVHAEDVGWAKAAEEPE